MNDEQIRKDWVLAGSLIKENDSDISYRIICKACWALKEARDIVFAKNCSTYWRF